MLLSRIESLTTNGISFDTETFAFTQGNLVPEIVCGSLAWLAPGPQIQGNLLDKEQALEVFAQILHDQNRVGIGANMAFDLAVCAIALAKRGKDIMPALYQALADGKIYDILIAEALNAIAEGHLGKDPRTNGPIINPDTGKQGRYSLATCTDMVLGRKDAKENDEWRVRYGELANIPIANWPESAKIYPVDDARNTHEIALAQTGHLTKIIYQHRWGKDGDGRDMCMDCGASKMSAPCFVRRPHRNLHDLSNQVYTAFAMHLGASWGFHVNQKSVDIIADHSLANKEKGAVPFIQSGLIRSDGTENRSLLKKLLAEAYGSNEPCPVCEGTGKVPSKAAKPVRCPDCKGRCVPWKWGGQIKEPTIESCKTCDSTGQIANPNPPMVNCFGVNDEKTCDGTGLLLNTNVPRSDKDGISYGGDTLNESGDEFLMAYAGYQEDQKILNVYVPYLRRARTPISGHEFGCTYNQKKGKCTCQGPYKDIPLTLQPNPVLETGRVSYGGAVMLMPRKPGHKDRDSGHWVPSLRECIEARKGWMLGSVDYEAGELITHGQSCLWLVGESALAEALNNGVKVHNALGATMIGLSYEEFQRRLKVDKNCKDARQAAKPGNFGFPGGMGPVRMVQQQRNQGQDTPHHSGPNTIEIEDENGKTIFVPGYKGLRFCITMDNAPACGIRKVMMWKDRKIPPTCAHCIECATRLKQYWLRQWPEHNKYFKLINEFVERGQTITYEMLVRWPWLQDVFQPGQQLAPGEIVQHHSGRIRGGVEYNACANGFFQGLLGDAAKAAVSRVSRECYDKTVRVKEYAHENSKPSAYADGPSPLLGSRMVFFVHDEILTESPESVAHDAVTRVSEIMIEELMHYCPDMVKSCAADPTLMRRWLKGAQKKVDASGKLIPWEPES